MIFPTRLVKFTVRMENNWWRRVSIAFLASLLLWWGILPQVAWADTATSIQPYLDRAIQRITEFRLDNGMKFIVLERHQAPVVSFLTYADVGGVNEPVGKTGVAHFLEHLAFKGTTRIGTKNYTQEKPLLDELDRLSAQIQAAKATGKETEVAALQAKFKEV